jgi:predicted alpha/beta-hydrolase family hydrolase
MLAAGEKDLAAGLLLLSYPLHPPRKPAELRTEHFHKLETPALFVHGSRDPFGSISELRVALELIPGRSQLLEIPGGGHELVPRGSAGGESAKIVDAFQAFFG